jgi:hypothetical protein
MLKCRVKVGFQERIRIKRKGGEDKKKRSTMLKHRTPLKLSLSVAELATETFCEIVNLSDHAVREPVAEGGEEFLNFRDFLLPCINVNFK